MTFTPSYIKINYDFTPCYVFDCPADCCGIGYGKDGLKYYGVYRYANGLWLKADGEPDMAFVGFSPYKDGVGGAPIYCGLEIKFKDAQLFLNNHIAYENAVRACCAVSGCGSGRTVELDKCKTVFKSDYLAALKAKEKR